jgi:CRP/FNR family transcriptional regulator
MNPISSHELATLPIFAGVAPSVMGALTRRAIEVRFAPNETVFLTGAAPRGWFIILEGSVRVVRGGRGRQHVVHTEHAGGTLGEVPLVERGTYPATAIAVRSTRCALFTQAALEAAIAEQPQVAFLLAQRLAARVRNLVGRLDERSAQTVSARLIEFLLSLPPAGERRTVALGMTQQSLAEELGTVREVVARTLRQLRRNGMIERVGGGRYRIVDRAELVRLLEDGAPEV